MMKQPTKVRLKDKTVDAAAVAKTPPKSRKKKARTGKAAAKSAVVRLPDATTRVKKKGRRAAPVKKKGHRSSVGR